MRRLYLEPHGAAFFDEGDDLVRGIHVRRKDRRHKSGWIVRLQPQCLVRHKGIGSRVRLVETVAGELLHQVENVLRRALIHTVCLGATDENLALLGHLLRLFLAHRPAQQVGAAERVTGQHLRYLHHLFLVENHAIGRLQDGFEIRVGVLDLRAPVLARDEIVDHSRLQRPRPEQCDQCGNVVETIRLKLLY